MINVVDRWMAKEMAFASLIITLVMSGPVILISLFTNLPGDAIYTELVWPSLASIAPMILYHTLPMLVAVAIIWCYGRYYSDGTLVTLHLTGRSILSVRAPGLVVAVGATLLGYVITNLVVPRTSGYWHDVMYGIRHKMNPALLKAGKYNELNRKDVVIFFRQRLDNEFTDVFLVKKTIEGEEKAYVARRAVLKRGAAENGLVLLDGSLQIFAPGKEIQSVNFDYVTLPLTDFEDVTRRYTVVDELDTARFLRERKNAFQDPDPAEARNWMREAVQRFAIPGLALPHTWLGLELLAIRGVVTNRKREPIALICAAIALLHFVVVVLAEQVGINVHWIWLLAAAIAAELALAAVLMLVRTVKIALPS
jgi:lipopolysaccharide export LptBFGC system permease protein LptF